MTAILWHTRTPRNTLVRARRPIHVRRCEPLINRIGARAKLPFLVHAHMLRHACGYALANAGHDTRALYYWIKG